MGIWYILGSFVYFFSFWYIIARKIWQPSLLFVEHHTRERERHFVGGGDDMHSMVELRSKKDNPGEDPANNLWRMLDALCCYPTNKFFITWTPGLPDGIFSNQKSQFG
jgi:hypothetical protein